VLAANQIQIIIPDVVLGETLYLVKARIGMQGVIKCLDGLIAAQIHLEPITLIDLQRVRDITASYVSANFDFVDCCIMAMSERLKIDQVYTFDRRDFSIFRPNHVPYLRLMPE
jgi:hypothetical protein